jgi:hypothetical protein
MKTMFNKLEQIISSQNMTHESINPTEIGVVENYIQAIYIPNIEIADYTKLPIICPGLEVNVELSGNEGYEDYIVGWIKNDQGGFDEIILNEEIAMSTTHPVLIMDNAAIEMINRDKNNLKNPLIPKTTSETLPEIVSYEHQIKQRYDNTTYSEFTITAIGFDPDGAVYSDPFKKNNGDATNLMKINDVHKNNIGVTLNVWRDLYSSDNGMDLTTPGLKIYYNLYERDWNRSRKALGTITVSGTNYYLDGKMKYSGDYYGFKPTGLIGSMNISDILNSWADWDEFIYLSKIRFWKVVS